MERNITNRMEIPPSNRKGGRPSKEDLDASPPVKVEPHLVPQPPLVGIRNPPCCRTAMVPVDKKTVEGGKVRCRCGHCGARLVVTYVDGLPSIVRKP